MPSYSDLKQFYQDFKNDKPMMWIFRIIGGLLVIALLWAITMHIKDGSNGKHTRLLWGLNERNIPKGYPDTVYKTLLPEPDTVFLPPVVTTIPPVYPLKGNKPVVADTSGKPSSKFNVEDNTFNAPSQWGDNNTQNIDYTVKQRRLTQETQCCHSKK